jgi:hypothetical protein
MLVSAPGSLAPNANARDLGLRTRLVPGTRKFMLNMPSL